MTNPVSSHDAHKSVEVYWHDGYVSYAPGRVQQACMVIHVPGFNEDALSHAPYALRLARAGFTCLVLDPPWATTPDFNIPSPALLFDLFDETDTLLAQTLEAVAEERDEPYWLGLTGFSMGGMFVARVLATQGAGHPFDAAAMILSSGDWSFMPRTTLAALPDLAAMVPPDALAYAEQVLRARSPVTTPRRFPPTNLLMVNFDADPRVPLEAVESFQEALRDAYTEAGISDALRYEVLPGSRHEFRRALQRRVREYLVDAYQSWEQERRAQDNVGGAR